MATTTARSSAYPVVVQELATTQIIPRQRNTMGAGVNAPYLGTAKSLPGGFIRGYDKFGSVLRFAESVTGAMIKTEDYDSGHAGATWNNNNLTGDTTLRANLCSSVSDITIDGRAELHSYPYAPDGSPDLHGPNAVSRADGIQVQGSGFNGNRIRLFQIPGTAIHLKNGEGAQAGPFGIYDIPNHRLDDIEITQAIKGIVVESTDTKLSNIIIGGCVSDGLTLGDSSILSRAHVAGADRSTVLGGAGAMISQLYSEAARIGTHITGSADSCVIHGLRIGPATCWYRGLLIEANGCEVLGIVGSVLGTSVDHTEITGVEIASGCVHEHIAGQLVALGDGCTLIKLGGNRNKVGPFRGGWNSNYTSCTFLKATETFTGCDIEIFGTCTGGIGLDLSATSLNSTNGLGNRIRVNMGGTLTHNVKYPGGGFTYNLTDGTEIWWNGVKLS